MRNIATSYYKRLLTEDNIATGEDIRQDIILNNGNSVIFLVFSILSSPNLIMCMVNM